MRLLSLRFKNLNSLAGEWQIDFTHSDYQNNGLFAIVGTTGAGKSTLLDAICLALYGQTPRLGKITKSQNEIMTRHYGECFAEVEFSIIKKGVQARYRCHWGQHRARKKASGDLQNPKHEIIDAKTNKVLASKIKTVHDRIIELSGLDFERFTRAILLAQGGFSAFLQAKPDQRSPILEQLTGTKIYTKISINVAERKSIETQLLKKLDAQLAGIQWLHAEDKQQKEAQLIEYQQQLQHYKQSLENLDTAIKWRDEFQACQVQSKQLIQDKQQLDADYQDHQDDLVALQTAQKAKQLAVEYHQLEKQRQDSESSQKSYISLLTELNQLDKDKKTHSITQQKAQQDYQQLEQQHDELIKLLQQVREIDTQVIGVQKELNGHQQYIKDNTNKQIRYQDEIETLEIQKKQVRQQLLNIDTYLEKNNVDQHLSEDLIPIQIHIEQFTQTKKTLKEIKQQLPPLQLESQQKQQQLERLNQKIKQQYDDLNQYKEAQSELQQQLNTQLKHKPTTFWRTKLKKQENKAQEYIKCLEKYQEIIDLADNIKISNQQVQKYSDEYQKLHLTYQQQIKLFEIQQTQVENLSTLLEEKRNLETLQKSLDQHRQELIDQEACPLCGALEHPYAIDLPRINSKKNSQQLTDARQKLQKIGKKQQDILQERAEITSHLEIKKQLLQQQEQNYQNDIKQYQFDPNDLQAQYQKTQLEYKQLKQEISHLSQKINVIETDEIEEKQLQTKIDKINTSLHQQDKDQQNLEHQLEINQREYVRLSTEKQVKQIAQTENLHQLQTDFEPYSIKFTNVSSIKTCIRGLQQRQNDWKKYQTDKSNLVNQQGSNKKEYELQQKYLHELQKVQLQQRKEQAQYQNTINDLSQTRYALFMDKVTKREEKQSEKNKNKAQDTYKNKKKSYDKIRTEYSVKQALLLKLETDIKKHQSELSSLETQFLQQLQQYQFTDEGDYKSACLSEQNFQTYQTIHTKLEKRQYSLDELSFENKKQLQRLEKDKLSDKTLEYLVNEKEQLQQDDSQIKQSLGAIKQVLADHQKQQKRFDKQLIQRDLQNKETQRWDDLYQLIGSADGKKFRNFAQGLTFEVMISHANQQLEKMSERYLLLHSRTTPLELNVLDKQQAGEVRSIKNLSGGESFIVSLALALGLSQMASENIQIDSLFLDEGFGTLDEDTLETVLEALSKLNQDNKIIGIISHVNGLKERISTQIQVTSYQHGKSQLSGAGIRCLKPA
jgi:exonuclease SbcC